MCDAKYLAIGSVFGHDLLCFVGYAYEMGLYNMSSSTMTATGITVKTNNAYPGWFWNDDVLFGTQSTNIVGKVCVHEYDMGIGCDLVHADVEIGC